MTEFNPFSMIIIFAGIALLPLLLMITTSFLKIAIVLVIVRNALGVQQVPPTMAIYAIALALTVYIMAPIFSEMAQGMEDVDPDDIELSEVAEYMQTGAEPIKKFMSKHADPNLIATFVTTTKELWPAHMSADVDSNNIIVLIPSFVISEIQSGFKIGFLIYLPFIVIDLLVSNLLLALGMQMVSPMTFSMPIKILLFVLIDGWEKLLNSLVLGYM